MALPRYVSRQVTVSTPQGRIVQTIGITDFDFQSVAFKIKAMLSLRIGLAADVRQRAIQVFSTTNLALSDIDAAEQAIVSTGVQLKDYWIDLVIDLEKSAPDPLPHAHVDEYVRLMSELRDQRGRRLYRVTVAEQPTIACKGEAPHFPDDAVVQGDPDHPEQPIRDRVRQKGGACSEVEVVTHRIGTAFMIPEFKTEWSTDTVFGCIKIDVPHFFYRQTSYVLVSSASAPANVFNALKSVLENCISDAALEVLVIGLVTGFSGFAAAFSIFVTSVAECLKKNVPETIECVIPDLVLVTETPDWHPV